MRDIITVECCKTFFDSCFDAIFLTKPDGEIIRANPAACKMFERTEEELRTAGRNGIIDKNDPRLEDALRKREHDGTVRAELNFLRKDGKKFPVDLTSSVVNARNGDKLTLIIMRDISLWKEAEYVLMREKKLLERLAVYDHMTKTFNRRGLIRRVREEVLRADREEKALSLVMVDLDHLKHINDTYGHLSGDTVLCKVADIISDNLRPYDIVGRYGGDEFLVCLPSTGAADGGRIAERLRQRLESTVIDYRGSKINATASFGVSTYEPNSGITIDSLISRADDQMYVAKRRRNSVSAPE